MENSWPDGVGSYDGRAPLRLTAWPQGMEAGMAAESVPTATSDSQAAAVDAAYAAADYRPPLTDAQLGLPMGATDLPEVDVDQSGVSNLHPGARFLLDGAFDLQVAVDRDDAAALIDFWSEIMLDHAYFYTLWLADDDATSTDFKARAYDLVRRWEAYRRDLDRYDPDLGALADLVAATGLFKNDVLATIRAGDPYVGAVYESFVLDNLVELDYFCDALADRVGGQAEIDMWTEHARDHALLDAHMFDPLMVVEVEQSLSAAERLLEALDNGDIADSGVADGQTRDLGSGALDALVARISRLAASADSPATASEAYLAGLQAVKARMDGRGARVSGTAPHRLVVHSIREIAYGLERIREIEAQRGSLGISA